jgi:hypothetical protein
VTVARKPIPWWAWVAGGVGLGGFVVYKLASAAVTAGTQTAEAAVNRSYLDESLGGPDSAPKARDMQVGDWITVSGWQTSPTTDSPLLRQVDAKPDLQSVTWSADAPGTATITTPEGGQLTLTITPKQ